MNRCPIKSIITCIKSVDLSFLQGLLQLVIWFSSWFHLLRFLSDSGLKFLIFSLWFFLLCLLLQELFLQVGYFICTRLLLFLQLIHLLDELDLILGFQFQMEEEWTLHKCWRQGMYLYKGQEEMRKRGTIHYQSQTHLTNHLRLFLTCIGEVNLLVFLTRIYISDNQIYI